MNRMSYILAFPLIAFASFASSHIIAAAEALQDELPSLSVNELKQITGDHRRELIKRYSELNHANQKSTSLQSKFNSTQANVALLALGAEDVVTEKLESLFGTAASPESKAELAGQIGKYARASVLSFLAKYMWTNEAFSTISLNAEDAGSVVNAPSYVAIGISLEIIRNSPQFEGEVRRWASDARFIRDKAALRTTFREWFRSNEPLLRDGNYAQVTSGLDLRTKEKEQARLRKKAKESQYQNRSQTSNAELETKENEKREAPSPDRSPWILVVSTIVIFSVASFLFLQIRQRNRGSR